ncbi:hypothetical protein BLJ79_18080 [Arthrobacter sp. UCD-GKA]|nr:hypothetical protein BLJ79_18080 [Arthrobacter sp. UCD-GKA]
MLRGWAVILVCRVFFATGIPAGASEETAVMDDGEAVAGTVPKESEVIRSVAMVQLMKRIKGLPQDLNAEFL